MITTPTVLILGAGASAPYGYPTGTKLRRHIMEALRPGNGRTQQIARILKTSEDRVVEFGEEMLRSGWDSLDDFLQRREEYLDIGKLAIAQDIARCESVENHLRQKRLDGQSWYAHLFQCMGDTFESIGREGALSIVTFNYDRSLDNFLFESVEVSYRKMLRHERVEQVRRVPIIHLHGQVGLLPWQAEGTEKRPVGYGSPMSEDPGVVDRAASLDIISEKNPNDPRFAEANKVIRQAKRIYFLGFGYHRDSLDRLNMAAADGARVCGTSQGLSAVDEKRLKKRYGTGFTLYRCNVMNFLRQEPLD